MSNTITQRGDGTYFEQTGSPPVGDTFKAYSGPEGTVSVNDIVVFDDPDVGIHSGQCEMVHSYEVAGYVGKVYAFDPSFRDEITPEVGLKGSPLGRLSINDRYVHVIPTDGPSTLKGYPLREEAAVPQWVFDMALRLHKNDEWDNWWSRENHSGWSAVGEEEVGEFYTCNECVENEYGPTIVDGK